VVEVVDVVEVVGVVVVTGVVVGVVVGGGVVVGVVVVTGEVVDVLEAGEEFRRAGRPSDAWWALVSWWSRCTKARRPDGVTGTEEAASVPPTLASWLTVMATATAMPPPMPSRRTRRRDCRPSSLRRSDALAPDDHSRWHHSPCCPGDGRFLMEASSTQGC
jgi:hypothetical protein